MTHPEAFAREAAQLLAALSSADAMFLCELAFADMSSSSSSLPASSSTSGAAANKYLDLIGVPLLPLASGAFGVFAAAATTALANAETTVWLATDDEMAWLAPPLSSEPALSTSSLVSAASSAAGSVSSSSPSLSSSSSSALTLSSSSASASSSLAARRLVAAPARLPPAVLAHLRGAACQRAVNVRALDEPAVALLVPLLLPIQPVQSATTAATGGAATQSANGNWPLKSIPYGA